MQPQVQQEQFALPEQASPRLEELLDEMYARYEAERAHELASRPAIPFHAGQCLYCAELHAISTTSEWLAR